MPYINKFITNANSQKAYEILLKFGYDMKTSQKLIDKGRLSCNGVVVNEKNAILTGSIAIVEYECRAKGLKPIFQSDDFAIFDKPSGVLSHPNGRHCEYSLCDEIWSLFGRKACVAHRLDKETSGLIVVAKNESSQVKLKGLFEAKQVDKSYLAMVCGKLIPNLLNLNGISVKNEREFSINLPMCVANNYDDIKMRMKISSPECGKSALTKFEVLRYFDELDTTLLRCYPLTGRQHQIRLHLFSIGHKIAGEPLYGLEKYQICDILDRKTSDNERIKITKAKRLCLHSDEIAFKFKDKFYKFKSEVDVKSEFLKAIDC